MRAIVVHLRTYAVMNLFLVGLIRGVGHTAEAAPARLRYEFPLAKFMTTTEPITLRRSVASYMIFLPVAQRMHVRAALLHLVFRNSISLLAERSQLQISLNDQVIAQVPLKPAQPEGTLDVRLPPGLLKADYNRLQFRVAQHYTAECEDFAAPELWTQIDPLASTLSLEADFQPLSPKLSDLANLFDRKLWGQHRLHILTATAPIRDEQLQGGALVAQGAALRLEGIPLHITHGVAALQEPVPSGRTSQPFPRLDQKGLAGTDTVLLGTTIELAPYLSEDLLARIDGSYLAVYPLDTDPGHFLLLISGSNEEEVRRAAIAFAFLHFPFPDAAAMRITETRLPVLPPYTAARTISENSAYPFTSFGFRTTTATGIHPDGFRLELALPPDLFAPEGSALELNLHLAYGAGLRQDSVLNILLNDTFETAIPLNQETGAAYRNYKISIPLRSFQPGHNTLTFAPYLMPLVTSKCMAIQEENLLLTLFDDSTLSVPPASHYVRLPDLQLFARTAFPHTVHPDGSGLAFQVAGQNSQTIAAAWMLLAKLAQKVGTPLHEAELSFQLSSSDKHLLLVGALDQLAPQILAAAPMKLGQTQTIPYPSLPVSVSQEAAPTLWRQISARAPQFFNDTPLATPQPATAQLVQVSDLGRNIVAMMFESPLHAGKSVVTVLAAEAARLFDGVNQLIEPTLWENLQGDVAIWRDEPTTLTWQQTGRTYHVGTVSISTRLLYYFSHYPWLWTSTVLVLIGLFALLTRALLVRFKRRYHGEVTEA